MKLFLITSILCFSAVALPCDYVLIHSTSFNFNQNGVGGTWQNTTGSTVIKVLTGTEQYLQQVTGHSDYAPWTSNFATLSSNYLTLNWSTDPTSVAAGYYLIVDTKYIVNEGQERWKRTCEDGNRGAVVAWLTRDRIWWTPNGLSVAVMP